MNPSNPEITGSSHILPFNQLSPDDFERMCVWLVRREGFQSVEHLGAAGSEQGRDITARREGKSWAFQCKRVQRFSYADAKKEIDKLPKDDLPEVYVFIVASNVSDYTRKKVRKNYPNMDFHFWVKSELDVMVKRHPDIVDEFFQLSLKKDFQAAAEIKLKVGDQFFNPSTGSRPHPVKGERNSPHGFNNEGLPDWGSLYTVIKISNIGYEDGELIWKPDEEKTKFPPLFNFDHHRIEFNPPRVIRARKVPPDAPSFFFDITFSEQDPYKFASAIRDLVLRKEQYEIVLQYWTARVDGNSNPRKLIIKGDFKYFYDMVIKHWEDFGFTDLIKHARVLE